MTLHMEQREGTPYVDPLALLPPQAERVLHVDCGAGALGEELKRRRACEVVGTEADEGLAEEAEARLDRVVAGPFESLDDGALGTFDAVFCGDLLCRTAAPEATLARLHALVKPSGTLLTSLPNLRHMDIVQSLVEGAWAYEPDSPLGGDHRRGFTRRTAEVLLEDHGFAVAQIAGVPARGHAEWEQVGRPGQLQAGRLGISGLDPEEAEEFFISEWLVAAEATPQADWGLTSIVVLTWNQVAYTQSCLESVRKHTHLPYELIVVDNGSTDGTVEWLQEQPDLRLIRNAENLGFPKAANQGLAAAHGENVLLLNNDAVVSPGWLRRLLTHLHARPEVGLVGPRSNFVSGAQQIQVPYRNLVEMESFAWRLGRAERGRYDATDRLVGFCLLAKRQVLDRIGVLDERFGLGCFEDDDLCLRARKAGFELRICRDAFVHHYGGRTFVGNQLPSGQILAENQRRFAGKWGFAAPASGAHAAAGDEPGWGLSRHPEGGLLLASQPSGDGPTISLCMIVRDEADRIRACLESARPYVDEIVVVDTGSRDETMCIARECGAQVIERAWEDSFSVARNVSLEHATGEWILWLDADDVLPPESGRALRECVRGAPERVVGFVAQVHCPGGPGEEGETVVDHVRLFRRRPDLRFELRIHEQILPSIRRAGGEIARAPIHVLHANYDRSPEGQRRKSERDQRLLALDLAEHPKHPFVHFNVGMTACHEGDYARAVQHLRTSIDLSAPSDSQVRKAYALMASAFRALGEGDHALAACDEGLRHSPDDAELLFDLALVHRSGGDLAQAEAALRRLLSVSQQGDHLASVDAGIFSYKARHNLAAILQESGRPQEAEATWQEVTAERPEFLPAWLALGGLLLAQGREDKLARLARRGQRVDGATGELLRGLAALRTGDHSSSERHLRAALAKRPDLLEARRLLSHALLQRGEREEAEEVPRALLAAAPDDTEAHHNLGALLLETGRAGEAVPHLERAVTLRPQYQPSRDALAAARRAGATSTPMPEKVG